MPDAVAYMQWSSYVGGGDAPGIFKQPQLSYNSGQARLHEVQPGERLWLVSRCPNDQQYYFIGVLHVAEQRSNPADSELGRKFGQYAVVADREKSHDLEKLFPAEGLLRALVFDPTKPVKHGASLGQSIQAIRMLTTEDSRVLDAALTPVVSTHARHNDGICGLWTKCELRFAKYFAEDWNSRREPVAFMLYDPPPTLAQDSPVFIHSDKAIRLIARFVEGQHVAGHKFTCDETERLAERERVWAAYRAPTLGSETKAEWDGFWTRQNGVRAFVLMDRVQSLTKPIQFKTYSRMLDWGYPTGVGYRYLNHWQAYALLRAAQLTAGQAEPFADALVRPQ